MKRRIPIALIGSVAVAAAVAATPATSGTSGGQTSVTTKGDAERLEITVAAASGQQNSIDVDIKGGTVDVTDESAGIAEDSAHCTQRGQDRVRCQAQAVRLNVFAGDGDDLALMSTSDVDTWKLARRAPVTAFEVLLGPGNDRGLLSTSETDTWVIARGQGGRDRLIGKGGTQLLYGGSEPDVLNAGAGHGDTCDGGAADDKGGKGCEEIVSIP